MTARRPRVHRDFDKLYADMLLAAETHDIIVSIEPAQLRGPVFMALHNAAGERYGESIRRPGSLVAWGVGRDITDQYVDAIDAFADVCAFFNTTNGNFTLDLSARDVGLLRLLGGRPLPPAVHTVILLFGCGQISGGWLVMDQHEACDVFAQTKKLSLDPVFFPVSPVSGLLKWPEEAADYVFDSLVWCQSVSLRAREIVRYLAVPTPLAPHWRLVDKGVRRGRPGEVHFDLYTGDNSWQRFQGPSALLDEQLRLIAAAAGRQAGEGFEGVLANMRRRPRSHYWSVVSRRIVEAVAQLAQLEPHLPPYVMLWIVDRLPGCVFYPELRKLRCVEATAARIRARLDSTTR